MRQLVKKDGKYVHVVPDGSKWKIVTARYGNIVGPRLAFNVMEPDGPVSGIETREEAEQLAEKWADMLKANEKRKK